MTEQELRRTALIIPPRGRAVLCVWAAVPGLFVRPSCSGRACFAGACFCALWGLLCCLGRGPAALPACSRTGLSVQAGIAFPSCGSPAPPAVTGVQLLRTPLLWLAASSVLVVRRPGAQLFLPGVDPCRRGPLAHSARRRHAMTKSSFHPFAVLHFLRKTILLYLLPLCRCCLPATGRTADGSGAGRAAAALLAAWRWVLLYKPLAGGRRTGSFGCAGGWASGWTASCRAGSWLR